MTEREALAALIRDKGHCNNAITLTGVWCSAPCPFDSKRYNCMDYNVIYERALRLYIKKYGKESLVEDLI